MKWDIDKTFSFCYGHRVHNQTLNKEFSEDACLVCRHLHGHEGLIKVHLTSNVLERGMVTDFKHLNWFKTFLDRALDHKFIMDINDPLIVHEVPGYCDETGELDVLRCEWWDEGYWTLKVNDLSQSTPSNTALYEKYEGMVFVDFVPTSENLASWLLSVAQEKMEKLQVQVTSVDFWETPKSHCKVSF